MDKPIKLPRVAFMSKKQKKKVVKEDESTNAEEENKYNEIIEEDDKKIEDVPYYYIDKDPIPKYIPPSPGREKATQIEDNELFDFEIEVEPVLEVLVGKTLVLSVYELIEEDERNEYEVEMKKIKQRREYELNKVQREEAARIRRNKEIERRNNQKKERLEREKTIQRKVISKYNAKSYLSLLRKNVMLKLNQNGYFNKKDYFHQRKYIEDSVYDDIEKKNNYIKTIKKIYDSMNENQRKKLLSTHKIIVNQVFEYKKQQKIIKEKEEEEKRLKDEVELKMKIEEKERRRVEKFKKVIFSSIISTKEMKSDIFNLPIGDIDELAMNSNMIHSLGGKFGELIIIMQSLKEELITKYSYIYEKFNERLLIKKIIKDYLLSLKETENFELKYIQSTKLDPLELPEEEEKLSQVRKYLLDEKRFYNKSISILVENGIIDKEMFMMVKEELINIYLFKKIDITSKEIQDQINPFPENQSEKYLKQVKEKLDKINDYNSVYEKLKKKVKLMLVKGEVLKKKKNSIIGIINVLPTKENYGLMKEEVFDEVDYNYVFDDTPVIDSKFEIEEERIKESSNEKDEKTNFDENEEVNKNEEEEVGEEKEKEKEEEKSRKAKEEAEAEAEKKAKEDERKEKKEENIQLPTEQSNPVKKEIKQAEILFLNNIDVFKNINIIGDCYVLHKDNTDYHKLSILKGIKEIYRGMYMKYKENKEKDEMENKQISKKSLKSVKSQHANKNNSDEIKENQEETSQLQEEEKVEESFQYSTKCLIGFVKQKYNICMEYIEKYLIENEKYYSSKRNKYYELVKIDVLPEIKKEVENVEENIKTDGNKN